MANILLSAYACEPGRGSEEGIGWGYVTQVAEYHDVWVITRSNNRAPIDQELARHPMPSVHWIYFDLPRWARFWKKGIRGIHLYYYLWQLGAYFVARKAHRKAKFDLVHHVTLGMYWMPTFLPLLSIPFVWGPVAGGESIPRGFRRTFHLRGQMYEVLRDSVRKLGELDPFVRLAARRATIALATSGETEQRLRSLGCRNTIVHSSVGLPPREVHELISLPHRRDVRFRVISIGRLLHWKGFELGLLAFARFHAFVPDSEYWVIGDGPERRRLVQLTRDIRVNGAVTFWGKLSRDKALTKLADCDALLSSSLHESGGYSILEAMAAGRPVVCLDLGGPALQVTEGIGSRIPALSPDQVIHDLAAALTRLANDPTLRIQFGSAGRQRVQECFNWGKKGALLAEIYSQILDNISPESNEQPIRNTI